MAENIYIGNRYIVKYMGLWDAGTAYESLSAVTYDNSAYISNKPVPAGTLPTDTAYWAFWGSGNAVIDALTIRVNALETQVSGIDARVTQNTSDILGITSRLGLAETSIDSLFATTAAHTNSITQIQQEIASINSTISSMQNDIALCERTANRNAVNGYMGLSGGYAERPTLKASPLIMTANLSAAQTLVSGTEPVKFNNVLHATQVGINQTISLLGSGNFTIIGPTQYYDVWVSASVLCVPTGNTGIKDIYVHYNNDMRFAVEGYFPTGASRLSISLPEVYLGPVLSGSGQFGVVAYGWTSGDVIGRGSIAGDNYGSTWVSIKAYPRTLAVT